ASLGAGKAPPAIHCRSVSTSSLFGGRTKYSTRSLGGGISPLRTRCNSRLSSGLRGTRAGPDFPPFNRLAWKRRSRPPSCLRLPWHTTQRIWKIGMTSFSVTTRIEALCWSTQFLISAICSGLSLLPTGGIDFAAIFSTSRLWSPAPGRIAAPDLPPFKIDSAVRRSRPACGFMPPWQPRQFVRRIGRMSLSKSGLPVAVQSAVAARHKATVRSDVLMRFPSSYLKTQLEAELDAAGRFRAQYHAEILAAESGVRIIEVHEVKGIEKLGTELQVAP